MFWLADASASGFVQFAKGADEARCDPSMLHVLLSQAVFFVPLLLPALAGLAMPYGSWAMCLPGVTVQGVCASVPMWECGARNLCLSEGNSLIQWVLFDGREGPSLLSSISRWLFN